MLFRWSAVAPTFGSAQRMVTRHRLQKHYLTAGNCGTGSLLGQAERQHRGGNRGVWRLIIAYNWALYWRNLVSHRHPSRFFKVHLTSRCFFGGKGRCFSSKAAFHLGRLGLFLGRVGGWLVAQQ